MKTRFFFLQLFLLEMFPVLLHAQMWKSVDDSTLVEHERIKCSDYKVYISTDRHKQDWKEIKVYGALVSNIKHRDKNCEDTLGTERTLMGFAMLLKSRFMYAYIDKGQPSDMLKSALRILKFLMSE